ncbi:adenylyltransferase/cytidyltransferase family protein [Photobacterium leiognathi]|uniref:adenylyltransferase/cytidyltransferase family protein n=1 Tax=Photobacterium leiognathi TaxID=553611 RepID=UPI00298210D0|nr:adenylyltransferase/cytidyltransferase family protein [Photobacterium leiognathi]
MKNRIMVDMSATLIHHGHIRLLKQAKEMGHVIVALTTDHEIQTKKGYTSELSYEERKEVLESIRYVDEVVPCNWLIDNDFLIEHNIDLLVHGCDNVNHIPEEKLVILPRTEGVSSSELRERVLDSLVSMNLNGKKGPSDKIAHMLINTIKNEFKLD